MIASHGPFSSEWAPSLADSGDAGNKAYSAPFSAPVRSSSSSLQISLPLGPSRELAANDSSTFFIIHRARNQRCTSGKIHRPALAQSIPGTSHDIARIRRAIKMISGNGQQRRSTIFAKHENGRSMRYYSKISREESSERLFLQMENSKSPKYR
jgi:hypothetical protein